MRKEQEYKKEVWEKNDVQGLRKVRKALMRRESHRGGVLSKGKSPGIT